MSNDFNTTRAGRILIVVLLGCLAGCASRGAEPGRAAKERDDVARIKAQTELMVNGLDKGTPTVVDEPLQFTMGEEADLMGVDDPVANAYASLRLVEDIDVEFSRDGRKAWSRFCVEVTYHLGDDVSVHVMDMIAEYARTAGGWQLVGVDTQDEQDTVNE